MPMEVRSNSLLVVRIFATLRLSPTIQLPANALRQVGTHASFSIGGSMCDLFDTFGIYQPALSQFVPPFRVPHLLWELNCVCIIR